jgi:excinuclease ABC subunit A
MKEKDRFISLEGVKTHGLKNISVKIPHDKITVITGLSGSGKSSLAIDTLFAEGQRRYLESLSSYARQFLNKFEKPEFEKISQLRPSIAIEQKTQGSNPRSTVGTITEIYDYLRVLFARIGIPYSPSTNEPLKAYSPSDITQLLYDSQINGWEIFAQIVKNRKGTFKNEFAKLAKSGFSHVVINGERFNLDDYPDLDKNKSHDIDLVVGSFDLSYAERFEVESACALGLRIGNGVLRLQSDSKMFLCSSSAVCPVSGFSLPELSARLFSFNSPVGACRVCFGLGAVFSDFDVNHRCLSCNGKRLGKEALCVKINNLNIADVCCLSLAEALNWIDSLSVSNSEKEISAPLIMEISKRLTFLVEVGLSYLTLERSADTLSGGEGQRIRLASQIGSGLEGVLYVLDEPSIGLHPRDQGKLIRTLQRLRDLGNTIVVVEHDEDTINAADYIIELGPRAGVFGGEVVFSGSLDQLLKDKRSITAPYLKKEKKIGVARAQFDFENAQKIVVKNAKANNLKNINVEIPLGALVGVCGVSGSGKSSFVMDVLAQAIRARLNDDDFEHCELSGNIIPLEIIDQSPIGRTPRSNPATYTGIMNYLRDWFASLPESKARGYTSSRFSFNVDGGRCKKCSGEGVRHIEMHFLPSLQILCEDCQGARYNRETLEILYDGLSISDVLNMPISKALEVFDFLPGMKRMLQTLCDVHLDYITLGQNAVTLSGGEAQRLKLAKFLGVRKSAQSTLYILDEPTTGLHFEDIQALLNVLRRMVDAGNSVLIIEHHIDILKSMDWLIEIGPEGGNAGGLLLAQGSAEDLKKLKTPTGLFF